METNMTNRNNSSRRIAAIVRAVTSHVKESAMKSSRGLLTHAARSVALMAAFSLGASAQTSVPITSYDIADSPRSGFGCWAHDYGGSIVNTGRTVSSSVFCVPDGNQIANYSGGNGSMDDGVIPTDLLHTHLLFTGTADDGQPIVPVITLHLRGSFFVRRLHIFGGDFPGNILPGALSSLTVELGGASVPLSTIPFGPPNAIGIPADDLVDLTGTPLAGLATDTIVLKGFTASFFGFPIDSVSIGEIIVDGTPAFVPVSIDIKPERFPNLIRAGQRGEVKVAILSTPSFTAGAAVDRTSLTFGRTGNELSLDECEETEDVNDDNLPDLICSFRNRLTGFQVGDTQGMLKGKTLQGTPIMGTDSVLVR
jgi:hypothetical protein